MASIILQKFNETLARARKVHEAAAAATAELTREMNTDTTTFVLSAQGVNFNQLVLELKKLASPMTDVVKEGEVIRITTTNPAATTKVLRYLGIDAKVDGEVLLDKEDKAPTNV